MFYRQTMPLITATIIVAIAVLVLPQTMELASAHFGDHDDDDHTFGSFERELTFRGHTLTLACVSFFAEDHPWYATPVKVCVPGLDEIELNNGCVSLTLCLGTAECTGTYCPPDNDADDDDTSGNN